MASVLRHSLPGPQAGQLQPHCCAAQTALQQPGVPLLHLHHHTSIPDNGTWHESASKGPPGQFGIILGFSLNWCRNAQSFPFLVLARTPAYIETAMLHAHVWDVPDAEQCDLL